jgi:outer membrane protein
MLCLLAALVAASAQAEEGTANDPLPSRIQGDVGLLMDKELSPIRGEKAHILPAPFAYFDYGRLFARLDTFGVKTLPLGYGYVEIAGRVKFDGYKTTSNAALQGIAGRENSLPVGLGSFQLTPIGGFFFYALHDINRSQGNLFEADYVAELKLGEATLYPEIGVEYYTAAYNRYYFGVTQAESAASGIAAYSPASASAPFLSLWLEVPVANNWNADFYLRRKWLGSAISNSPLTRSSHADSGFIALVRHFE